MSKVRVATFNCENLFARFLFEQNVDPDSASENGFTLDMTKFEILNDDEKRITAQAIRAANADVVALQEVDSHEVLRRFRTRRLAQMGYEHTLLVDGNDPRHIDVAVLSRYPIVHARSYHHLRSGQHGLFSRDCLEVDVAVGGQRLTLFVNHFKAMLGGRARTRNRRKVQADEVRKIVRDRFGPSAGDAPWIIAGDLNDYLDGEEGIGAVTGWDQAENVLDRLPEAERWTHFYESRGEYRQLDYLLVSRGLAQSSTGQPEVVRKGLCRKATRYSGERFAGVGDSRPAASDHCPLVFEVNL